MLKRGKHIFLAFILFVPVVGAQDLEETNRTIQASIADRRYSDAVASLKKIKADQPGVFAANNYAYLLARLADRTGDVATAAANYQAVANSDSVLKEYALFHLAQVARGTGNLLLERTYLQRIAGFSAYGRLSAAAWDRLSQSWFESGSYDQVIKMLSAPPQAEIVGDNRKAEQTQRQRLVLLGDSYLKSGNTAAARDVYTKLITTISNPAQPDDFALAAVRGLDILDEQAQAPGTAAEPLPDLEHLRRASIYQFNRDFNGARKHYNSIIENFSSSALAPDAMFQIGRGYAQEGNFNEAVNWFERVIEKYPDNQVVKDALLQSAAAYARLGKYREAVTRYQRFVDTYKDDERLARAYLNVIDVLRDSRQDSEALQWTAKVRDLFKGKQPEALALFSEAKIYLSRSDWMNALAAAQNLQGLSDLGSSAPGGTNATEVAFIRGLALENLGRYPEAIDAYLSIPDGRGEYYGSLATERLRMLAAADASRAAVGAKLESLGRQRSSGSSAEDMRRSIQAMIRLTVEPAERDKLLDALKKLYASIPAYAGVPHFELVELGRRQVRRQPAVEETADRSRAMADELLFLGLYDEAAPLLDAAYGPKDTPPAGSPKSNLDYTLAVLHSRGDRADRTASFIEPLWKMPADFQVELIPRDIAVLLYPTPFADHLRRSAPARGVDPRFLLSIMRQESRFRPDVKSYAAARGLMQFISSTAARIADEVGRKDFRQDDMYDPATAILFGSQYVGNLFKLFPRQPEAVAASYNGGEDNMKRWMARSRSDEPGRYVPEIAFSQSKDYVYRVMANYRVYQLLYDAELKAK